MARNRLLKLLFYLSLGIVGFLVAYKVYLNVADDDLEAAHAEQVERIQQRLEAEGAYRFAVVGNINNSVGVFERRIVPRLNRADIDFVVSAGNAVSSGGEDKYRALSGALRRLDVPYLLTFGEHEESNFGSFRFYEHFGPYFFAFNAGDSHYVFLDATGKSSYAWQLRWLEEELAATTPAQRFVFLARPVHAVEKDTLFDADDAYLDAPVFRDGLLELIRRHGVDAVFSANLPLFARTDRDGTSFITTGGAGGLVLNNEESYYHYVLVSVSEDGVSIEPVRLDIGQHPLLKTLESLWLFVHSLFYTGYLNFILIVSVFMVISIRLYWLIFTERDYYPDFDVDPTPYRERLFRVAMFTNNYLPFIGGVPLSIERLRQGLTGLGHAVQIVAPRYDVEGDDADEIVRVPSLFALGDRREFRVANPFNARARRLVRAFRPHVVHLHHPFWLGSLGLFLARRLRVPAIYTYHTRLEHYAHYVALPGPLFRNLISHALVKRFANKCDGVIVPTQSAEEYLRLIGVHTPIFVQPTGIDHRRFQNVESVAVAALRQELGLGGERVCISVSRLSKEKNIDFLLDAVARLRREVDIPFRLLIIGDGQERQRLQDRLAELQLLDTVTLVGAVAPETMPTYYALGDLFMFASKSETQGMVILEAMAAGMPVVAVRSSGIDDVVQDGITGFKTPENREVWARRAAGLLVDDVGRAEMARAAQAFAARHDVEPVAREVAEVYAYVLAARDSRTRGVADST